MGDTAKLISWRFRVDRGIIRKRKLLEKKEFEGRRKRGIIQKRKNNELLKKLFPSVFFAYQRREHFFEELIGFKNECKIWKILYIVWF